MKSFFIVLLVFYSISGCTQERDSVISLLLKEPDEEFVAITCDKNWEHNFHYASIVNVDGKYVMYYRAFNRNIPTKLTYCYAESLDGIHWTKPNLGLFEYEGNTNNNIISDRFNGASFEYKDGKFYLLADRIVEDNNEVTKGLYLFESDDGKKFIQKTESVPIICDSQNQLLWDKWTQTYKWYLRSWSPPVNNEVIPNHSRERYRTVSLFETQSPDLLSLYNYYSAHTSQTKKSTLRNEFPVVLRNEGMEDFDIYTPCVHSYRKDLYIAYPTHYYHIPDISHGGKKDNDGYGVIAMWISKDGKNFTEVKSDYMTNGNNWLEYCIGHIETKSYFIHYYITFDNAHVGPSKKNSIIGRIHYKNR